MSLKIKIKNKKNMQMTEKYFGGDIKETGSGNERGGVRQPPTRTAR